MRTNILDRAISAMAPAMAAERLKARAQVAAMEAMPDIAAFAGDTDPGAGGFSTPSRWWRPRPRDAKADTLRYLPTQRGQVRELARTSPIAVGAIDTNINRVVGTGMALSADPQAKVLGWTPEQALEWKALVQNEFSLWADSAESDIAQTLNFYEQQALVLRAVLESGDCFTNLPDGARTDTMPYALRIQVLEADRCGNPQGQIDTALIAGGVKTDQFGAPQEYFVYDQHPGGFLPGQGKSLWAGSWQPRIGRSGRRRILHHYRKLRPEQPRGVPYLAPIIDCIKQISRYTEAEIMAAVISAYLTVFVESPTAASAPVFDGITPDAGAPGSEIGLGMGAVVGLAPGEKASVVNPGRPNPNFEPFITAVIKQMGMGLGIPFELLMKQFNASYSASKAALLDAWIYFRSVRTWLSRTFCQPVYETWLAEAVILGRVPAPGFFADPLVRWAYTRAGWPGDSMGSINPKDEVAAYAAAIDARLMTRERAEWELFGSDWNGTFDQKKSENERLKAANMLPVPKAGAAAGPAPAQDDPAEPAEPAQQPGKRADALLPPVQAEDTPPEPAAAPAPAPAAAAQLDPMAAAQLALMTRAMDYLEQPDGIAP